MLPLAKSPVNTIYYHATFFSLRWGFHKFCAALHLRTFGKTFRLRL